MSYWTSTRFHKRDLIVIIFVLITIPTIFLISHINQEEDKKEITNLFMRYFAVDELRASREHFKVYRIDFDSLDGQKVAEVFIQWGDDRSKDLQLPAHYDKKKHRWFVTLE